jgi:multidrug efflux pump
MISRFFIDRPIFASVVSIAMTLIGGIALFSLPIAQYPRITPPGISITINYPGASAQVVAETVAAPVEQSVNGIEGMLYMSSQMGNDGSYTLTVTFDIGIDLNTALVMVQNRVALAMPQLPTQVQNQGITIRKRTPDILMIVNFISPAGRYDNIFLSNYATIHVRDELLRVPGVSDINYQGQRDYSIRVWLDPQKLAARNMTALDVAAAIRAQNLDAPVGQVGQSPAPRAQSFQLPIDTLGRLEDPDQFGDIIVKASQVTSPTQVAARLRQVISTAAASNSLTSSIAASGSASRAGTFGVTANPQSARMTSMSSMLRSAATSLAASGAASRPRLGGASALPSTGVSTVGGGSAPGGGTSASAANSTTSLSGGFFGSSAFGGGLYSASSTSGGSAAAQSATAMDTSASSDAAAALPSGSTPPFSTSGTSGAAAMTAGPGNPSVGLVRLRDIARIELGAQNYNQSCLLDGKLSVGIAVYQLPGTNALEVADNVRAKMEELKTRFPDGVDYVIAYDTTPFTRESISDVVTTLLEATALVAGVVLVFLQSWRSVIIPMVSVPVAIISTFAVMAALDFSLNNISLFGLVLAIGIVVDDAIVVVENVERWLERGLKPREATRKAMDEVTGPIIAVALVLCAVFVPCAFVGGITGQFFRQFAVTISVSTIFSTINSLTLSPALAAILLKPHGSRHDPLTWLLNRTLGWGFRLFNWSFGLSTSAYAWTVAWMMRLAVIVVAGYVGLLALTWLLFSKAPVGFVPQQDQGRIICSIQLPDAASLQRTEEAVTKLAEIAGATPGIAHSVGIAGMSFVLRGTSPNYASMFIVLKPFSERHGLPDTAIMARLRREFADKVKDAKVTVFGASPVPGLGVAGGFKVMVEDRGDIGLQPLQEQTEALVEQLQKNVPGLVGVSTEIRSRVPQLFLGIDRLKAASLGVSVNDVNQTLNIMLGSLYVNSFNAYGRYWQVTLQAEGNFRNRVDRINLLQVRNNRGQMAPLGTLVDVREINGPTTVNRYNLYSSAAITGNLQTGYSSGLAIEQVQRLAEQSLPLSMKADWTELMFMQKRAGNTSFYVFALSVASVFLALSALYESWSLPMAVILVVPLCLLCSMVGVLGTHRDLNIFVQIGLIVLVGLACKNAILIVEFARQLHEDEGQPRFEATKEASRLRLRPILMTSFAFIFGVLPLVFAAGAGAEMRRSLGTAVFSGMLGVTLFGIFLTPVFFYVIQGLDESRFMTVERVRWATAALLGALLGGVIGFLLTALEATDVRWAPAIGAAVGLLLTIAIRESLRIYRKKLGKKLGD